MVHALNPSVWEEDLKFKASLCYTKPCFKTKQDKLFVIVFMLEFLFSQVWICL